MCKMTSVCNNRFIQGRCMTMCPEKEILFRERNGLLHTLEKLRNENAELNSSKRRTTKTNRFICRADKKRMVKSYSRPAAGQGPPDPKDIRPPEVLLQTVKYLLTEVVCNRTIPWYEVYDFVFDRLRAVRQDLVVQGTPSKASVKVLEPIVRFLAYAGYRLCEEPISNFDPIINRNHLLECVKILLLLYDQQEECGCECVGQSGTEALYLLVVPGSTDALLRAVGLPDKHRSKTVIIAYEFSLSCYLGNYVRAFRQVSKLPALHACLATLHLPHLRRQAIQVMSAAFSSRNLRYPVKALTDLLMMSNETALIDECRHYGLSADTAMGVSFSKDSFNHGTHVQTPVHLEVVDKKLAAADLSELILGNSVPMEHHKVKY